MIFKLPFALLLAALLICPAQAAKPPGEQPAGMNAASRAALDRGLAWLASKQQKDGNCVALNRDGKNQFLAIEALTVLAFVADGYKPGMGKYGQVIERGLNHILSRQDQDTGLFNEGQDSYHNYNHGFTTMALAEIQAILGKGKNKQLDAALEKALKLIEATQCEDGGWDYRAARRARGHDLSLAVCQTAALASLRDGGHMVSDDVFAKAAEFIRQLYDERRGGFRYSKGDRVSLAMTSAGVVGLYRLGKHDDPRLPKCMEFIDREITRLRRRIVTDGNGLLPMFQYDLFYSAQALLKNADKNWIEQYSTLRDGIVKSQIIDEAKPLGHWRSQRHVRGDSGTIYTTATACLILAMPQRRLPVWAKKPSSDGGQDE